MREEPVAGNSCSLERWTSEKSAELYGVRNWGAGYFDVSRDGNVIVIPDRTTPDRHFSLFEIVSGLRERGWDFPLLLRLGDLLDDRIRLLHETFASTFKQYGYKGAYRGVYPIKVNQQQQVVEEITRFGRPYHHGLEAGSKAELIAAISFIKDPEAPIICNGYKDSEFLDLGLYAQKMGLSVYFVIEMPGELQLILDRASAAGVTPNIGVRMKLSSRAGGHWNESGGDRSVFGLNVPQLMDVVDSLRSNDQLQCLKLLHYHLGSQIPNIRDIRVGITEACRVYAGLIKEGAPMGMLDLGGGLAVDYDGSHTNFPSSSNYSVQEYCADIVEVVMAAMDEEGYEHPTIVTESGRATVAYSSVLLFNVLDVGRFETHALPDKLPDDAPEQVTSLMEVVRSLSSKNVQECYHDAMYYRDEIRQLFTHGHATLQDRSIAEKIFWHTVMQIKKEIKHASYVPDEFEGLEAALADVYYCNFSVFQSLPDVWAIDQLFPIMPIHRLCEKPDRSAILADITCDCDGKIDRFIDLHDINHTLTLHQLKNGDEYILGVFLVGAYQETLGDLHNLMGDTNVISVHLNEDGELDYTHEIEGDSVADVLSYVEYAPRDMIARVRRSAEHALRNGLISAQERKQIMEAYESGLRGYTYFER